MYINIKSEYNFLDSIIKIDDLITYAKSNNYQFLSICDINNTFGLYKFYLKCKKEQIKPILGCEFIWDGISYLVYAKNQNGVKRLYELNTLINRQEFFFNEKEKDLILVINSPIMISNNQYHQKLENLYDIFENDLYFGYNSYLQNKENYLIYQLTKEKKIKGLNTEPKKIIYQKDAKAYETLVAINQNDKVKYNQFSENLALEKKILEELNEFQIEFLNKINIELNYEEVKINYPFLPEKQKDYQFLRKLAFAGLKKRKKINQKYVNRLEEELKIIRELNFSSYFLIVWDIVKYAKNNNIYVGPGRGSACGSLVAYCVGITDVDPIANKLLFERFLNQKIKTMPDIDVDFEDRYRDQVVDYIINRFGKDNVCKIGTLTRFLAKSVFRDVCRVNKIDLDKINYISKTLNKDLTIEQNFRENKKFQNLVISNSLIESLIPIMEKIESLPRQTSIHAAGIIISTNKITNYCAISNENVSLQEANELEKMGLLKMDILALNNLTIIHEIVERIKLHNPSFDLQKIKYNDQKTMEIFQKGNTLGIFQAESQGMTNTFMQVKPTKFFEIPLVLALYRPGPKEFIKYFPKIKQSFQKKDAISEILEDSYGLIVYQEQIMQMATKIANYDLNESDLLRKAISKKKEDDFEKIKTMREEFIKRGIKNGYEKNYVEKIYDIILKFCHYGFNKSHAYAYGKITYIMAYLKANYKQEFFAQILENNYNTPKKNEIIQNIYENNIKILSPNLFKSDVNIKNENKNIRLGLTSIQGINQKVADEIVKRRQLIKNPNDPIEILEQIIIPLNLTEIQIKNMIFAGLFSYLDYNYKTLETILLEFNVMDRLNIIKLEENYSFIKKEEYSIYELSKFEKESIGVNIKYDLFDNFSNEKATLIDILIKYEKKGIYEVVCQIEKIQEIITKKQEKMAFLTINSKNNYELVIFSKEYKKIKNKINKLINKLCILKIEVKDDKIILLDVIKE